MAMREQDLSLLPAKSRQLGLCRVCGDVAIGINFAVPTCAPCKAFFRRNAVKLGKFDFVCLYDGDCRVSYEDRRICSCCRLAKCFRAGMQRSRIQSDEQRQTRRELVVRNREKRTTLELIQEVPSIRPAISLNLTEHGQKLLSESDQTLLTNIFHTYERVYPQTDTDRYSVFPSREHSQIHMLINEVEERTKPMIGYVTVIPEFSRLSIGDQAHLVRTNFGQLFHFNELILTRSSHDNFSVTMTTVFGSTIANDLFTTHDREYEFTRDPLLLKLILTIWSFSMGMNRYEVDVDIGHIFDNTLTIFACENIYVELLWRYLVSRLPSTKDVVKFFNTFVVNTLWLQSLCLAMDRHVQNVQTEIEVITPLMQNLWPSWKKAAVTDHDSAEELGCEQ